MSRPLAPAGLRLVAGPGLRRVDDGRVLIGGAPLRIIRLSARGSAVVDAWLDGAPLADVKSARRLARRLLDAGMLRPLVTVRPVRADAVTVVTPVKDDAAGLARLLGSLGDTPAVVVDDGSVDPVPVRELCARHGARLIRRERSGGPGPARADGLAEVDTPLVALVDADVEVWAGWLDHLVGHFDDESVVAVAPRVRSREGPGLRDRYERHHSPIDLGSSPGLVGPGRPVGYVPTAALVLRLDAVVAVGGFDLDMRWGEDVDLVWRLIDAGGAIRYEPDVEVVHDPRGSWVGWLRQRLVYGGSAVPLGMRHGTKVAPARCSPWSAAAWAAAAAGHPLLGTGVAAASTAALATKLEGLRSPVTEAARLAIPGHLHAGRGLARAVTRAWWPLAVGAALAVPRLRRTLAVAVIGPALTEWVGGRRPADPVRSVALRVLDDMAYGAGVWEATIRHRDVSALVPDLTEWPGRRSAVEADTVTGS